MSAQLSRSPSAPAAKQRLRIGSVSFLNAKPLIYGLDELDDVHLSLEVPSRLLDGLMHNRLDVALLPVIDFQRMAGLRLISSSGIGCDGPTLTVRIFSPLPVDEIRTLVCDTDSHTSVALARVILAERYGITPKIIDFDFRHESPPADLRDFPSTAQLLIGDKVVCQEPTSLRYQIDLGQAWKELTGLPFVFATWMARPDVDPGDLGGELDRAKHRGMQHIDPIIAKYAVPRGWPAGIAKKYLTEYLQFDIGPKHLEAIRLFHRLAHQHGIIEHVPWDI